jgi:hypothetical protein
MCLVSSCRAITAPGVVLLAERVCAAFLSSTGEARESTPRGEPRRETRRRKEGVRGTLTSERGRGHFEKGEEKARRGREERTRRAT